MIALSGGVMKAGHQATEEIHVLNFKVLGASLLVAMVCLNACSSEVGTGTETPSGTAPAAPVEGAVPVEVDPGDSGADESGNVPTLSVQEAAGAVTCGKPEYGSVVCKVAVTNTTDQMAELSTEMAMIDAQGTRLMTDGRYEEYVAPGETYIASHYGEKGTTQGRVLSVEFDRAMSIPTEITKRDGNYFLPTSNASVGKCRFEFGEVVCSLTITNSGPVLGEIDTTVAFYGQNNVRLYSETRYEEKVAQDETYRQDFYGPKGTKAVKVLALELQPTTN